MDEDDYKIKEDFEGCWGIARFSLAPSANSNKRNENKLGQLKGNEDSSKGVFVKKQEWKALAFH